MMDKELFAPELVSSGLKNDVFSESKFNFLHDINSTFTNFFMYLYDMTIYYSLIFDRVSERMS